MPIYKLNGDVYDIPQEKQGEFESQFPDAFISYTAGADQYDIPVSKREDFLKDFPDAQLYSMSTPEAPVEDPLASAGVPMFDDEPQAQPQAERGFRAGARESWKGMKAGFQNLWGETANLFTESSQNSVNALNELNDMVRQGKDVSAEVEDAWTDAGRELRTGAMEFLPGWMIKGWKSRVLDKAEKQKVLNDIRETLAEAGGDVDKARMLLEQRAQDQSYGDVQMAKAAEKFADVKPTEGFGAWVGSNIIQMIPSASALIVGGLTKSPAAAKAIGMIGMGGMTASTAGSSMYEARESGASDTETWKVGIVDGMIEYLTEKLPFDRYTSRIMGKVKGEVAQDLFSALRANKAARTELENLLKKANERLGGKLFSKKNLKDYIADMMAEGASEFSAEALQTMTSMMYEEPENYPTINEILTNGWEGAKAGFFMGAVLGGASKTMEHTQNRNRRMEKGSVDVALVDFGDGEKDVVEVVEYDDKSNTAVVMRDGSFETVSGDAISDGYRFSFDEFEKARLREMEDEAIVSGNVTDGQIQGLEEAISKDIEDIRALAPDMSENEISAVLQSEMSVDPDTPLGAAVAKYQEDVTRHEELVAAKRDVDAARKEAVRSEIETAVGQRFWVQESGEDDGSGIVPVSETVEEVVYADGRVGYVVGSDDSGNLTMVFTDGTKGFSSRAEIVEKENSGEILSNTVMGLDDYLAIKMDIEEVTREEVRMQKDHALRVEEMIANHPQGTVINVGTEEAKVEVPIIAPPTKDGVIVQMPDGTTPMLTWEDVAHAEKTEITPRTNAQINQSIVDEYRVAYTPAVPTAQSQPMQQKDEQVKMTSPANPLPLKADGTVDQTALWNKDPERWAQWNDEQRQDGGANTLAYVSGAIAKEQAKIAELQAAYAAESDFDARDAIEKEIADTQARVGRLTAIQQGYVAQAGVEAAPVAEAEPVAPRVASQMNEQEKAARDAQHQARLDAAKSTTAKREAMQNYINEISQGSVPMTLISMDEYEQVMKDAGCTPKQIAQVKAAIMNARRRGQMIPAFFVPRVGIFAFVENIPNIEQLRLTYVHERQHQFTAADNKYLNALLQLGLSRERLAEIVATLSDSHFYDNYDELTLADEVISYAMERAYTYEDFSVALQELGIEQEIIDIITEIDNEQRNEDSTYSSRRRGRYDLHDNSGRQGDRAENDRNPETISGGLLDKQGNRPLDNGSRRTGSTGEGAEVISEEQLNAPNSGTAQQITATDGEVLADTDGKGGVRFSIRTWNEGGRDYLAAWLANDTTLTEEEKADILARMDEFYKNALLYSDIYVPFGTWSDAGVRYDNNGNPLMSVIKANGDYAMNLDFSLVCKKRRPLNRLLRTLVNRNAFATYTLRERELAEINWILQEHGFEVACALCFVDSKRYRVTGVADVFAALYNRLVKSLAPEGVQIAHFNYNENPNVEVVENGLDTMSDDQLNWDRFDRMLSAYKPGSVEHKVAQYLREHPEARKLVDATDFIEAEGFESVKENNPDLLKFYNMKKGTGGPKASFGDVQYLNDILKKEKSFDAEKAYAVGGVRLQSFSDFVPHMYFDYMQLFAELAAKKLPLHAYTKEVLFAKLFGLTGAKINMSLVPAVVEGGVAPGLDVEGNYAWADPVTDAEGNVIQQGQSFPYDEAMAIQHAEGYSKNCGVIAVGISDAHIEKMLDDPNIPFIIPYHKSSLNAIVARMTNIDQYKDYTNVQNTRKASGSKLDKGTKDFNFNEYLHGLGESGTPQQAAQAYLDWCRENNYKPKFSQFAYHPNYYKLLQDFNTIDLATGEYAPQGAVTMTFPTEESAFGNVETLIQQGLQEDAELEEKMEQEIDGIADQVLARLEEISKEPKMSEKQQAKRMAELADERTAKIKAKAEGPIDLIAEAQKAVAREERLAFRVISQENYEMAERMIDNLAGRPYFQRLEGEYELGKLASNYAELADIIMAIGANKAYTPVGTSILGFFAENPDMHFPLLFNDSAVSKETANAFAEELSKVNDPYALFFMRDAWRIHKTSLEQAGLGVKASSTTKYNKAIDARAEEIKAAEVKGTAFNFKKQESSLDEIDAIFKQLNKDPELALLHDKVMGVARKLGVKVSFAGKRGRTAGESLGDKVSYDYKYFNSPAVADQKKCNTITHELIHSITVYAIYLENQAPTALTDGMLEAVGILRDVYNQIARDPSFKGEYGVSDVYEMVAELSNAQFREKLKEKNLFQRILDALKRLLGIDTVKEDSAYQVLSDTLDYIIENYDEAAFDAYALYASRNRSYGRMMIQEESLVPGHKKGQPMLSDAEMMADVSFRITKNTKATIEKWFNKAGVDAEMTEATINYLDYAFEDTTEQLCAAKWYLNGKISLPDEDEYKVRDAVKVAKQNKVDALSYASPMEILNTFGQPKSKVKPINPDTVKEFSNKKELAEGIVVYDVQDDFEGQAAVRKIIDTHWGEDANPWCLAARTNGDLERAKDMWLHYSKYPKRIAFRNGKLLAFYASANDKTWWDRNDEPHTNIPYSVKSKEGEYEVSTNYELKEGNKKAKKVSVGKSDKKGRTAYFVGNRLESAGIQDGERNLFYSSFAAGATLSDSTYGVGRSIEIQYGPYKNVTQISFERRTKDEPTYYVRVGYGQNGVRAISFVEGARSWDIRYGINGDQIFVGRAQLNFDLTDELSNVYSGAYHMYRINDEEYEIARGTKKVGIVKKGEKVTMQMLEAFGEDGAPAGALLDFINDMGWNRSDYPYPNPMDADLLRRDDEVREQIRKVENEINEIAGGRYLSSVPAIRFRTTRTEEQREQLFDAAKAHYGLTSNFNASGYMLPDGSLLDFSEANDGGDPNRRSLDHRDIEGLIMDEGKEYDSRYKYVIDFVGEGAIRMLPEYAGFQLSVPPTAEQKSKLMDYIYKHNGEVIMEITDENGSPRVYMEYNKRTSPSRIFRDMDGYFNEGIVPGIPPLRFRVSNENQAIFVSNAAKAVEGIKQEKATPEQWLKMIEKNGGLKAGEDKWMGLSDWLKASDKKTLTKQEVLDFINENMIIIEEQHYSSEGVREEADMILNEKYPGWDKAFSFDWDPFMEEPHSDIYDEVKAARLYNETHEDQVETDEYGDIANNEDYTKVEEFGAELAGIWYGRGKENTVREINGTREEYTTEGLTNLHEIALTVPSIEPWNESDDIHFGDAGNGRAVAWIRFGDTQITEEGSLMEYEPKSDVEREIKNYIEYAMRNGDDFETSVGYAYNQITDAPQESVGWTEEAVTAVADGMRGKARRRKVLVIDEIQSKRHQEGREKGYISTKVVEAKREAFEKASKPFFAYEQELREKYDNESIGFIIDSELKQIITGEEYLKYDNLRKAYDDAWLDYRNPRYDAIPDAPFDKNWHELAMKRMLRYAAENGYDVIAWTKGDQQAERYNIGSYVSSIEMQEEYDGNRDFGFYMGDADEATTVTVDENGIVVSAEGHLSQAEGRPLADLVGKDMAVKMMQMEEYDVLEDTDLKVGNEGMKGFYDKMLPAFMNKYGKKWGVKVEDINLPNLESGLTMHSVPVTDEMKASVMEGQVMFRVRREDETPMEFTQQVINDCTSRYNEVAEVKVFPANEETAERFGFTMEEMQETGGTYLKDEDIIAIFALQDIKDSRIFENIFFHESIHKLAEFYPEFKKIGEWMWNNADVVGLQKIKNNVKKAYDQEWHHEEMLTYGIANAMSLGRVEQIELSIPEEYKGGFRQILNEIGYEPEKESRRDENRVSESLRRGTAAMERKTDESGRSKKEEARTGELTAEERRIIGEYFPEFNKSEDVRYRMSDVNTYPTEAQKKAGNYKMGHLRLDGYNITIENPKGSVRRGTDSKGNAWENTLNNDYGYIRGTEGVDGDHIDVYLSDNPTEGNVFVIDQVNPETREFDEHKVMYGFNSAEEAREAYLANFSEGWNGLGTITEVSKEEFKKWIESSHRKTKPFSEYKSVRANEMQSTDESELRYRVVTDQETLDRLNSEPTIKVYRAMQLIDGKLYPPMSAKVDGELRQPIELGQWEEAEERPDLVDEKGRFKLDKGNKSSLKARYNPYFHTSPTPLNDQFSSAQTRPELVTVEVEVPESELTSGYKAEKAKDSVGKMEWKAGVVQSKLSGTRTVILSRWDKPVRIVPDSEVADVIVDMFEGRGITMPSNVVTPSLRAELEKRGVPFVETDNQGNPVEEVSFRVTGTPTDEVVTNGLQLTPAQTAEVAANIFAALPEESRKKITDGLNGNILGLKDAILQIPTSLATKEKWNDVDKQMADVIAEEMTKMAGEMTRPFSAEEGLWLLYNNLNKGTDLISLASRALVQRNLGFDAETIAMQEQAKEDVRFRTVGDATSNAQASLYNRGAVNVWTRLKESFVDMQASVEELVKAIEKRTGKVAQGFENILLALNQQSSKGLAAMESYTQKFLNPMFDEIRRIMNETDFKYEDIVRYVILKHGLERNKKLAQRDAKAHYQEIYDDIIAKINSMDDRQKRTYLTNAQLKEADAKARLATLQAKDTTSLTDEELKAHKKELANARREVKEAEEYRERAEKIRNLSEQEAQDELDKIFEKIENGTDSVYKEMRENDYSGISSMFYDQLGVDRKNFSTEEQYQAALMEAKKDRYSSLKDVEAAAEAEIKSFEGKADTKELWKRINAATKETLRQQYEANMISKDQYENLRNMFEYYVPLRGFKDNTAEDMYTYYRKPNSTGYTKPILGAEGRKTEAESPFGWIAAMAGSAIASNVKNEAKLALYYFVSNRPENGIATISKTWFVHTAGDVDERGKKIFRPVYPPFSEDLSTDAAKQAYEDWQANMKELQKQGQAYEAGQRLNLGNAVVNISDVNKPEHIVNVKVGGKDYTIIINGNPRAAQAINGDLNIEGTAQDYSAFFGPILRWMSSVNTSYNPEFWITNMMRDMAFTMMAVNIKEDPAYRRKFKKNYLKAFKVISLVAKNEKGTIGDSYLEEQYKDFVKYGGVTGYTQIKDSETWEKEIDNYLSSTSPESLKNGKMMRGMKDAFHAAHRFGESLEQVSRFAAFLTARETGKSISEAINDAKEITVNFNRKGSGKMITLEEAKYLTGKNGQSLTKPQQLMVVGLSSIAPFGRRFIMFFNAAIQGLNATYKLMKKNPKRFTAWALGYAAVGMMNALLHAMMDDDDDYLDIPQYERRNSFMIGGNGAYFKWALPQEARAFYALGDLAVETVMGRNPHQNVIGEALKIGTEILPVNPSEGWKAFMPSVAMPAIELMLNEDYKGAPIYNKQKWLSEEEKERTAKWSSAYQGTGWIYVKIAQGLNFITGGDKHDAGFINLQPEKLEHLVQSAFGGTIRTADKFINTISAAIDPEEPMTVRQTPFLNRFLTINDERFKNVHVNDVFDYYKADAEHALTLEKQYIKDRDKDSLTKLRSSDEYQWAKIYGKYKKPLKAIQDKIKVADGTAEKKELMKQQDELKKRMIKEISEL